LGVVPLAYGSVVCWVEAPASYWQSALKILRPHSLATSGDFSLIRRLTMPSQQGSLDLLQHPVAQEMLQAPIPMRLAYSWTDGSPRVIPIGFHWDGTDLVIGSPVDAPKMKALTRNPKVAATIDSNSPPWHVLLVRGTANITIHDGIIPEYVTYCHRYMGEAGATAWLQQLGAMISQMARIAIRPEWVGVIDFEQRLPSPVEKAIEAMSKRSGS
jgi:hypothetical protein